jgi:hypothetical protein
MAFHHHKQIAGLEASSSEKAVLRALADFADLKGLCWPSYATVATVTGLSRRTVIRVTASLKQKGLLRSTTTLSSNRYVMTLPKCHSVTTGVPSCHPTGDMVSPEYTNESTNEQINESFATQKDKEENTSKHPGDISPDKSLNIVPAKNKHPDKPIGKIVPAHLEDLWKKLLPSLYPDLSVVKKFTQADYGMLKQFIQGVSPNNPYEILGSVLNDWSDYTSYVKSMNGLKLSPHQPVMRFIVKYCAEAANFHLKMNKPKVTPMSKPVPVVKPVSTFLEKVMAMPDEKKTTMEDILALEKELGL